MATKPKNEVEICIRIDRDTLAVDATKVAERLVEMLRRRYRAKVTGTAVIFPRASDRIIIAGGTSDRKPSDAMYVNHSRTNQKNSG